MSVRNRAEGRRSENSKRDGLIFVQKGGDTV